MGYAFMETPIGELTVQSGPEGLEAIFFGRLVQDGESLGSAARDELACVQLKEYFNGTRNRFELPLVLRGTPFQRRVWQQLLRIPYGETRTYGQIARAIGQPGAARAVGMANHQNPIPIVVPCHRVIGHDGTLTGYGGGLKLKAQLLNLEGVLTTKERNAASLGARGRSTEPHSVLFS